MPASDITPSSEQPMFTGALKKIAKKPLPAPMSEAISKLFKLEYLDRFCEETRAEGGGLEFIARAFERLRISVDISPGDLARIPKKGPVVVVANHPFGMMEGAALIRLLAQVRPDVRVLANDMLGLMPDIRPWLILVDPFGGESANRSNRKGLREALDWLNKDGLLVIFPAGEVSHVHFRHPGIHDPSWNHAAARLIKHTGAAALPLYFDGANSAFFQIAGMVHPRLRTALLPREILNKQGHSLSVRVGHPIPASQLADLSDADATERLRRRTYWLAHRKIRTASAPKRLHEDDPLFEPIPQDWLRAELEGMPKDRLLVESGSWQVWLATRDECPFTVREIGRLREETFRKAGEGTGKSVDLDEFDDYYQHLVLWRKDLREIAGAYRLCGTDRAKGRMYTKTLYRFNAQFFRRISPAVELGRSFIRIEHQRSFQSLLLLWRGIGEYLVRNPQYRFLFGPVSVSNSYQKASRVLMAQTLLRQEGCAELSSMVKPRWPFLHLPVNGLPHPATLDEMDAWISDLEPGGEGMPVLLRQYLKMGGHIATFHVDRNFGETLDGLIVVDLSKTEPRLLERYMGKEGIAKYFEYQRQMAEKKAS
jgi:putative hemolysin